MVFVDNFVQITKAFMTIIGFISRLFSIRRKRKKILTIEAVNNNIAESYFFFQWYGIKSAQVFLIHNGIFDDAINEYLLHYKNVAKDFFFLKPGDYFAILGAILGEAKYIIFQSFDESYNRKVGNFICVKEWPPFHRHELKIEDVFLGVYQEFKDKV